MTSLRTQWTGGHAWLQGLESPFVWRPADFLPAPAVPGIVQYLTFKNKFYTGPPHKKPFTFAAFVVKLMLGYELYAVKGNASQALSTINSLGRDLLKLDNTTRNPFYRLVRKAQWHIYRATRGTLLAHMGRFNESKETVGKGFPHLTEFKKSDLSAICGIKSLTFQCYGVKTAEEALHWAKKAIEMYPKEAEWYFLAGKSLELMRRWTIKMIPAESTKREEFNYFSKAVKMSSRPVYALYLANVLEQMVVIGSRKPKASKKFKDGLFYKSLTRLGKRCTELYRRALQLRPTCIENKVRVFEGLMKLPKRFLSQTYLLKLLETIEKHKQKGKKFFFAAAMYYLKVAKNNTKALGYLEEGANRGDYACGINLVRLRHYLGHKFDAERMMIDLSEKWKHHRSRSEHVLSHLVSYYLFKDPDLAQAVTLATKVLKKHPKPMCLLAHDPIFLHTPRHLNLLPILLNEIKVKEIQPLRNPIPASVLKEFQAVLQKFHPKLLSAELKADLDLMSRLHKRSAEWEQKQILRGKKKRAREMERRKKPIKEQPKEI